VALVVICPGCKIKLTLGDDRAGETLDCPKCDLPISVPVTIALSPPVPVPRSSSRTVSPRKKYAASKIKKKRIRLIITVCLILLPLAVGIFFATRFYKELSNAGGATANSIDEFAAELRNRPEFSMVGLIPEQFPGQFRIILPRDREYECAYITAHYADKIDGGIAFMILDCSSKELAIQIRNVHRQGLKDEDKSGVLACGQFVFLTLSNKNHHSAEWLKKNYGAE
jgi:hypothetical protein